MECRKYPLQHCRKGANLVVVIIPRDFVGSGGSILRFCIRFYNINVFDII